MAKRTKRPARHKRKSTAGKARARKTPPKKARKSAKRTARRLVTKAPRRRTPPRQPRRTPELVAAAVETTIVDVIENPLPGVVTVTEVEAQRVLPPVSDEENED